MDPYTVYLTSKIPLQLLFIHKHILYNKIISWRKYFQLDNEQLKEIARSFKAKVEEGLNTENAEIQCIPTFITPKASGINGKSLVLDLGGTNYRVAIVDFSKTPPTIHPNNGWKRTCRL